MRFWLTPANWRLVTTSGAVLSLVTLAGLSPAAAQVGSIGGIGAPEVLPPPVATERPDMFVKPGLPDDALIAGGWLIYPSAFIGGVYDSNVNQSSTNAISAGGIRLTPSVLAQQTNDLSKTTLYSVADGRIYIGDAGNNNDALDVNAGIIETYQPLADLIFTAQGDYTRQKDLFATLGNSHTVQNLNPTGVGLAPTVNPQAYNQLTAGGAVQKNFASAFVTASGSIVGQIYDSDSGANRSANNVTYTGTMRGGWWITPAIYGYLEGSGDARDQSVTNLGSSGYRVLGGLGTDQIGLVRGEVYAGYQAEGYNASVIGTVGSPVYGMRGYYYPLPELTLNVSVDEELGASLVTSTPTAPFGTATRVTTALGTAEYALSQLWAASGRGGYIHTEYIDNPRRDNAWTIGSTVTYRIARNIGVTLDYQHIQLNSNIVAQSFTRDVVTFGMTVKY